MELLLLDRCIALFTHSLQVGRPSVRASSSLALAGQNHPLELSLVVAQCSERERGREAEDDYNSREAWKVDRVTWLSTGPWPRWPRSTEWPAVAACLLA